MSALKILHVNNICGIPSVISKEEKKMGYKSIVLDMEVNYRNYRSEYNMRLNEHNLVLKILIRLLYLFRFINFDVFIFHQCSFLPFYIDSVLLKLLGKKVIYYHHGFSKKRKFENFLLRRFTNIVSTPDLIFYFKNSIWIPQAIDMNMLNVRRHKVKNKNFKVFHSSRGHAKRGTDIIKFTLIKNNINFRLVDNVNHEKLIKLMKGCDLVIDNLIFRVYGVLSVEAMAMGIPVMSNIDNKYFDNCPIIECNKENIEDKLNYIVNLSNENYIKLSKKCIDYVLKVHDSKKIAKKMICIYESMETGGY